MSPNVANHYKACQLDTNCSASKAPLMQLLEPFRQIAMDIVGPLLKSRSRKCYILVVCDYATRYPEAVALKSIDAQHINEELVFYLTSRYSRRIAAGSV